MRITLYRFFAPMMLAAFLCPGSPMVLSQPKAQESKGEKKATPEQEKKPGEKDRLEDPLGKIPFWDTDAGQGIEASAQCFGAVPPPGLAHPWGVLGARILASAEHIPLPEWHFAFDTVLPIYHRYLEVIQDGRTLPSVFRKQIKELPVPDQGFYLALNEGLRRSDQATMDMFEKSAEENKLVVYPGLRATPDRYRGKIITVKGKLALIRREDPPRFIEDNAIKDIYTGWIVGPAKGIPPFTVVSTELPKELIVSEKLDVPVTFYGYFLAHVRFPPDKNRAETQKDVISPYLVGKTVIVHKKNAPPPVDVADETPYAYHLIVGAIGSFLAVVVLGAVLTMWFRRGDQKIQSQLAEVREKHHPFTLEGDSAVVEPQVKSDVDVIALKDPDPAPAIESTARAQNPNNGAAPHEMN